MTFPHVTGLRTLQARLLLALALIGTLPLMLVGLGVATLDHRTVAEQSARELTGLARGLATAMDISLAGLLSNSQAMAALPDTVSLDPVRQETLLKELFHHYPAFARLSTFDLSGQRLASSHAGGVPSIAARRSFQTAAQYGAQAWEAAHAFSTGRASILISTPIRDADRRVVGMFGAVADFETLSAVIGAVPVGGGGRVFVLDGEGRVLLHPDAAAVQERHNYAWLGVPTGGRLASPGTVRYTVDGVPRLAGYAPVSTAAWTAVVERPEMEMLAPARGAWAFALTGMGISTVLALLCAIFLARRLSRPVRELAGAARALGSGDAQVPLPAIAPEASELGTLVDAFASMRAAVTRREEALRQSEVRYRTLFDSHPHPLWVYDLDTLAFLAVNDAAVAHYGYSREEFLAMTIRDIRPPEDLPALAENLSTLSPGFDRADPWRHQTKDGTLIDVEITSHSLRFDGRPARLVLAQDITARTQAQAERELLHTQLRQAQKMEAIGTLAGGIAHDFNNILATILGYTELALDNASSASATRRQLQEVLTAAHRARDLVRQILTFSRKGEQPLRPVPLQPIVQDALRLLRASLPATIDIHLQLEAPTNTVLADPTQLHQVLMNLGSNAEYAMRETGGILDVHLAAVEVTADFAAAHPPLQAGACLRLTITDTGHGMAPEIAERIFEPFFTTKGVGEGTGLGLAVVHGIITDLGGAVTVTSALGAGTTFAIYLPCVAPAAETSHEAPPLRTGQARVLWVDDEAALAHWGQQSLAHLGYEVAAYTSSREALEAFQAAPNHFDLVITDQTMPHLTGEALTRALRRLRPDIPIILCTGFSRTLTAEKAASLGIQAYLMKPFGMRELSRAIWQALTPPHLEGELHDGSYSDH
jgi:PAS domain S-box-containing protein